MLTNMIGLRPNTTEINYPATTTNMSQYHHLQQIHESSIASSDDVTVPTGKVQQSTRLQLMVSNLPNNNTPDGLLRAVREIIAALKNKLPSIKVAKWNDNILTGKKATLVDQIPNDVEKAELYLQNFSRFSNGKKGYFRIQVIHYTDVPHSLLVDTARSFNVPQQQGVYTAASMALNPQSIGMLIGSTEAMMDTKDLYFLLTRLSKVSVIGFTWKYINTGEKGKFNPAQKALYIETESESAKKLSMFFQKHYNEEQNDLFGAPITFLPTNSYPTTTQAIKIKKYAPLQTKLMSDMLEHEVELSNFIAITYTTEDTTITSSLLEALMQVKSINPKTVVQNNKQSEFFGKVFYSAITNAETKLTIFQFPAYNETEANSILRALPLFIRDFFQLDIQKKQYCRSHLLASAQNGEWNNENRTFLSPQDKREKVQFENLELVTQATTQPTFISADHQRAMTGEAPNDDATNATNLHKNTKEGENDDTSTLTENTGSTRTSKAKAIAAEQVKEIALQYVHKQEEDKAMIRKQQEQLDQQQKEMTEMHRLMKEFMEEKTSTQVSTSTTNEQNQKKSPIKVTELPDTSSDEETFVIKGRKKTKQKQQRDSYFVDDLQTSDEDADLSDTSSTSEDQQRVMTRSASPKRKANSRRNKSPAIKRTITRGTGGGKEC